MILRAFFLFIILGVAGLAQAQQYRWVDKDGRVQYTDTPPPAWAKDARKTSAATGGGAPAAPAAPAVPFEVARVQKDFPVTLYTSPNCKKSCDLYRDALNKRGVPFTEVQVWDRDSNAELVRVSGANEVPVLFVGHDTQRGFESGAFNELLDNAGYPRAGSIPARSQKAPPPPSDYVPPGGEAPKPVSSEPAPKAGPYDPSGLKGTPQEPGPYGVPGESK